jgi:hypothetical protein
MLFILAMKLVHLLFKYAQNTGALCFLHGNCERFRMSLHADDAAVFIKPTTHDLLMTKHILDIFGEATCLITNMDKIEVYPIICQNLNLTETLGTNLQLASFPCVYLGLPLHFKKLPRSAIVPMVQKVGNRLPGW